MRESKYDYPEGCRYYDEGWNDCCNGQSKPERCTRDYRDGWNDCNEAQQAGEVVEPML